MVLMSSFSGQQWRNRHRKQTYGPGEAEEGEGRMGRELGGRFGREETWVYLWLIFVDV